MSFVVVILIGLFVGWVVAAYLELDEGIFSHMGLGAVGALIGAFLEHVIERDPGLIQFESDTIFWCAVGALFVTGIIGLALNTNKNSDV